MCVLQDNVIKTLLLLSATLAAAAAGFQAGVGIADTTGPAAEVGMMGYAKTAQKTAGIHTRLFSRAFVIADGNFNENKHGIGHKARQGAVVCIVVVDAAMVGQLVKMKVISRLNSLFGPGVYSHSNVVISATHTHAGPGGYMQYMLLNITTMGFVRQTFWAMVNGIVKSIVMAHRNMVPARLYLTEGELYGANINRSPTSYLENPPEERDLYSTNADVTMTQLMFFSKLNHTPMGLINWFPVHATSMNNTNRLISSDNKGLASLMFEKKMNPGEILGKGPFVAAFATSNHGDVSPNTEGPQCRDTGRPCHPHYSTCSSGAECIAFGPGNGMEESTKIIAERQFNKAFSLFTSKFDHKEILNPDISYAHEWIDMTSRVIKANNPDQTIKTCSPAFGYSFAAGTTDGPGEDDLFVQGITSTKKFWRTMTSMIGAPSEETVRCQKPKPILLSLGEMSDNGNTEWSPRIVDTQLVKIGNMVIAALPGEFTTMAGRRVIRQVENAFQSHHQNVKVVLSGLSNAYTSYVTTYEEYQKQRYEAASTLYGPHTLAAYLDQYQKLSEWLITGVVNRDPHERPPSDLYKDQFTTMDTLPMMDAVPFGYSDFGACKGQTHKVAYQGQTVAAKFVSGHPRNNLMLDGSFLTVEKEVYNGSWIPIATDADWETKFIWKQTMFPASEAQVVWEIPKSQEIGRYRLRHFGYHKQLGSGKPRPYSGACAPFKVLPASERVQLSKASRRREGKSLLRSYFDNMMGRLKTNMHSTWTMMTG